MNKLEWDLTSLFPNEESFYKKINDVKHKIQELKKYENLELDATTMLDLLDKEWEIKETANYILVYGSLMYYKNIKSEECINRKKVVEEFETEVKMNLKFIDHKLLKIGKDQIVSFMTENPDLKVYELYIDNLFRMQKHVLNEDCNIKIKENCNCINERLREYNQLLGDIEYGSIEIDSEVIDITSSNFAKYITSKDRDTRRQTYFVVNKSFQGEKEKFARILNGIYHLRIENATLENYQSVLDKVLYEENIDFKIINTLIESVHNNLFLIQDYLKLKADLLGIENPHLYDLNVPLNQNIKTKYSINEAIEIIKEALKPLGTEYLEIVDLLLDGHIDAELSEQKHQSITFSWHTYSFMNFRGSYADIKNLIHEIGHIVNYYLSKEKQPYIYEDSTIFVGETASIINEILLNKYLYEHAQNEEERIFYLSKEIENYFTSVFKQTMYTEFENNLYQMQTEKEFTPDMLCEQYQKIIKNYYGPDIIYDDISSVEWTRLGHLYRWSYYPYKYATGLLIASVVVNSLINEKTLTKEQYIEFLSSGSNQYSLDLLKILNVDFTNSSIIDDGFKVLKEDIKELKKVLKK